MNVFFLSLFHLSLRLLRYLLHHLNKNNVNKFKKFIYFNYFEILLKWNFNAVINQ